MCAEHVTAPVEAVKTALVRGKTFQARDGIKALGGRWDEESKAWRVPVAVAEQAQALVPRPVSRARPAWWHDRADADRREREERTEAERMAWLARCDREREQRDALAKDPRITKSALIDLCRLKDVRAILDAPTREDPAPRHEKAPSWWREHVAMGAAIMDADLSTEAKLYLLAILKHRNNDTGDASPSVASLLRLSSTSKKGLIAARQEAIAAGFLEVTERPRVGQTHATNVYRITVPHGLASKPSSPPVEARPVPVASPAGEDLVAAYERACLEESAWEGDPADNVPVWDGAGPT